MAHMRWKVQLQENDYMYIPFTNEYFSNRIL